MGFEQATIRIENEQAFGKLKAAISEVFSAGRVEKYLKKLSSRGIRVRDLDAILAAGVLEASSDGRAGQSKSLYEALPLSDQAQMRELYLSQVEEVSQELRTRFSKVYQYY